MTNNNTKLLPPSSTSTEVRKQRFLENYPKFLRAVLTAKAIGIDQSTHYEWLNNDTGYNLAFQDIKKEIDNNRLEENELEIHKRGLEKSDLLLMFETKALSARYRDKFVNVTEHKTISITHVEIVLNKGESVPAVIEGESRVIDKPQATGENDEV